MLADLWPIYALRIRTRRVCLRLPDLEELAALAELAGRGVHRRDERPFLTPWAEGTPDQRSQIVFRGHWSQFESWQPTDWCLGLGVFLDNDEPVGMVSLRARDFRVLREVSTSSWLGREHQGQGIGTEARTALLALAFDHLGATDATTEVFPDNYASQAVSRKLGYRPDGISRDVEGARLWSRIACGSPSMSGPPGRTPPSPSRGLPRREACFSTERAGPRGRSQ